MAYKMTKSGSLDNEITNEFICDSVSDLNNIPAEYINLGSIAFVIDDIEAYIANSNKQWISMTPTSTNEGGGD